LYEVQVSDVEDRTETSVDLRMRAATRAESRMLIDGDLVAATAGAEFDNVSPATGLVLGHTEAVATVTATYQAVPVGDPCNRKPLSDR
jgi:hypothetical protein